MEEDFFNIDFKDAEKLDILNLPDPNNKVDNEEDNKTKTETKTEDDATNATKVTNDGDNNGSNDLGEGNPTNVKNEGSPNDNISSSIAFTLADNGVLQTLDEERLKKVTTTEELIEAFREDLHNQLDEQQQRVLDALNAGVEASKIQQYEQIINTLNNVTDETIEAEGTQYEDYRKNLIFQNYINKGFDEDDAKEMTERSVNEGNDVEDAKKALNSLKKFYQQGYESEINENKKKQEKLLNQQKRQLEELKTSIVDDDDFYKQFDINKTIRNKIYDTVAKPLKQKDGSQLTEIQKYMKEKPTEALKMFGTMYVITEGFTKFDGILKGAVNRKVKESTRNLERLLNQSTVTDGSLTFKSGIGSADNMDKIIGFDI